MILYMLLMPIMSYEDAMNILKYEIPDIQVNFMIISFVSLLAFIATRSRFLGKPYRKITILLPLLHMCIYTGIAINAGIVFLNKWADEGLYSKGMAIALALTTFVVLRLLMSLLYWKVPIVQREET